MDAGMVGGIAGSVIGVMGGVIGTYFNVKNTSRPRERALMIRLSLLCWLWLAVLAAWLLLITRPWNQAAILMIFPVLLLIPWGNRRLARAHAEDQRPAHQHQSDI
jgi:ABC-type transport system involved in multi-copper enzyme maturation permease subunit